MSSALLRSFLAHAGRRVVLSVGLLLAVTAVEAAGLLTLVPLVELLGLGQVQAAAKLGEVWRSVFRTLGIEPNFELVLLGFVGLLILQAGLKRLVDQLNVQIETSYVAHLREELYAAMVQARWLAFTRLRAADLTRALTQEVDNAGYEAPLNAEFVFQPDSFDAEDFLGHFRG